MTLSDQCAERKRINIARNKAAASLKASRAKRMAHVLSQKKRREFINAGIESID